MKEIQVNSICKATSSLTMTLLVAAWASPVIAANPQETDSAKGRSNEDNAVKLPGARPTIHASEFTSLQAALDAVPSEGAKVVFPAGRFEIEKSLVISKGEVLIEGAGAATHIVNRNQDGQPAILVQHPDGSDVKNDDRLWRIMLSKFRVTGNPQSGAGIVAVRIQEVFMQGLTVSHHGGDGIRLDHCYEDPRISDCLITYNAKVGLNLLGCHDIVVSANQFEENNDALHCIDGFNLCMTGNCVDDHLQHGVVIENTYGSVVSGNMIEECKSAALIMDRNCYGNTVSANVIAHNGSGVDLRDAHGCSISANTFTINKSAALRISGDSGRITATGNNFSNSYIGEGDVRRAEGDRAAAGLVLDGGSHVLISGNVFSGLQPKAVEVKSATGEGVQFAENLIVDSPSDHENLQAEADAQ